MLDARAVHDTLRRHQLVDGYDLVVDLERSHGSWIHDAVTGKEYLDAFTCFGSWPIGYNHPHMTRPEVREELARAAANKIANADLYTREMAGFVEAFAGNVTPAGFHHHFWISGGSLAVENAMKTAFDWKARKLGRTSFAEDVNDLVILHFRQAFHGRSGYTLSVTNTIPDKVGLFPKFDWPRVHNPFIVFDLDGGIANDVEAEEARSCREIEAAFDAHPGRVAAILIEPMQGEGGDNHFRPEFLAKLRTYADERESLLVYDEVQTGFYGSGTRWMWEQLGPAPDVVAFGKKSQVCGIYAGGRIDEVPDNVFAKSSRINSTWGGNLVDMVRARHFIEIIERDGLAAHARELGLRALDRLRSIARETGAFTGVRGRGTLVAFTFEAPATRKAMLKELYAREVLALPSGTSSVRFRLPLNMAFEELDTLLERTAASVGQASAAH